jgi:LysM repeat protein
MSTAVVTTITERPVSVRVPSAQPRQGSSKLRITKRGRVVLTSLAAVPVVAGVMLLALNGGGATATSSSGAELEEVTVQAGQSLWSLAEDIAPGVDPRDVISDILSVNQLETGSVQAGQRLMLPAEYSAE